jgi:manganese/zinc/iron transport system permease protein
LDSWITLVGVLCAVSCALPGTFLVLRRMSMMGDAISHAVLPGLAVAFLVTGSRDSFVMLAGAGVVGVLTALFVEWIHGAGRVDQSAAMGVVFTVLFAVGLIVLVRAADHVDLDPGCVLYGAIETVPLDTRPFLGLQVPRAAVTLGTVLLGNLLFVVVLYKELRISTFDPALATALGFPAKLMHYLLMTAVAVTTVASFESVGSILVIAMLIVPPATAMLLSDRLGTVLALSGLVAAASAILGHLAALTVPGWFGYSGVSTSTAGMMAVAAGFLFATAMLLGPRHGLLSKVVHRMSLSLRIVREDLLGHLFRQEEAGRTSMELSVPNVGWWNGLLHRRALAVLRHRKQIERAHGLVRLTATGRAEARRLVRSHRLWETYFDLHSQLPSDHLHGPAERLEHVTDVELQDRLSESIGHPRRDPHGSPIPSSVPDVPSKSE